MEGVFLSLEGPEGCGKSTQGALLADWLRSFGLSVVTTREPGGTPTGEMIRDILQHHASGEEIAEETEMLLFAASRAQHVAHVIRPALQQGTWVVCDRFVDSSLAYQGVARGMGLDRVLEANELALNGLWPNITLWFDLSVETCLERVSARKGRPDRFEAEAPVFHRKVSEAYAQLADRFADRFVRIPAADGVEVIAKRVQDVLRQRYPEVLA